VLSAERHPGGRKKAEWDAFINDEAVERHPEGRKKAERDAFINEEAVERHPEGRKKLKRDAFINEEGVEGHPGGGKKEERDAFAPPTHPITSSKTRHNCNSRPNSQKNQEISPLYEISIE
jgi:hypothetical protein